MSNDNDTKRKDFMVAARVTRREYDLVYQEAEALGFLSRTDKPVASPMIRVVLCLDQDVPKLAQFLRRSGVDVKWLIEQLESE